MHMFNINFTVVVYTHKARKSIECMLYSQSNVLLTYIPTVEPPNKGHFGNGHFVLFLEAVPISEAFFFYDRFCIYARINNSTMLT